MVGSTWQRRQQAQITRLLLLLLLFVGVFTCQTVGHAIGGAPEGKKQSDQDISRAFMNCLLSVDHMVEDFGADVAKFNSEIESETKRCNRLKDSCKAQPSSVECEVFVEEFSAEESS